MAAVIVTETEETRQMMKNCTLCEDVLNDAKLLPCQHSFCTLCLHQHISNKKDQEIPNCPTCEHPIDTEVDALPRNFLFNILTESDCEVSKAFCVSCDIDGKSSPEEFRCLDCSDTLCQECKEIHCRTSITRFHKVVPLTELHHENNKQYLKDKKHAICEKHSTPTDQLAFKFYCEECECLTCQHCVILDHQSHKCSTLADIIKVKQDHFAQHFEPLTDKYSENIKSLHSLTQMEDVIKCEQEGLENEIHEEAVALQKILEKIKGDKLSQVRNHYDQEIAAIDKRKTAIKNMNCQIKATKMFAEYFLEQSSNSDFLHHAKTVKNRMDKCAARKTDGTVDISHLSIKNTQIDEAETLISGIYGTVSKEGSKEEQSTTTVSIKEKLSFKEKESTQMFNVKTPGGSVYSLAASSTNTLYAVCGYKIHVFDESGNVQKSMKCGKIQTASRVAAFEDDLYISDMDYYTRQVVRISKEGDIKRIIKLPKGEKNYWDFALGLAVTEDETVYICSPPTDTIYRCTKYENSAKPFIVPQSKRKSMLSAPMYICTTPNENLIVSNHGSMDIQAYSPEGKQLWSYPGSKVPCGLYLSGPRGVVCDKKGYIYVADCDNHRVQVLTSEGVFSHCVKFPTKCLHPRALEFDSHGNLLISYGSQFTYPNQIMKLKLE